MLKTVRSRILFFAFLSAFALSAVAVLAWLAIATSERAAEQLIKDRLTESWLLNDFEQDLRQLQDLSYKIKGQVMLWDEITTEYQKLSTSLSTHWQAIGNSPDLNDWAAEQQENFDGVSAYVDKLGESIGQKSYYQAGRVVDFDLFPAVEPMLGGIVARQTASRNRIDTESTDLLVYLNDQKQLIAAGSAIFIVIIGVITLWLRKTVIVRLQQVAADLVRMDEQSDLSNPPRMKGSDEVAGVTSALAHLVSRFEVFIGDIRKASASLTERSIGLDDQARALEKTSETTYQQIRDVTSSMAVIGDQASFIDQAAEESATTLIASVTANSDIQEGLRKSEQAADRTVDVIGQVSDSIQVLSDSSSKIEQVIGVIADIAEQTNLLALNAAIEAARAGEHGRGFAVVADEVRTLSRRTSDSTGEIRQWVADLMSGVNGVDHLLADMTAAGEDNRHTINELREHLSLMDKRFSELEASSQEISASVTRQRDEVGRVGRRSQVLADNADQLVESVTASREVSKALRDESDSMRHLIARFRISEQV